MFRRSMLRCLWTMVMERASKRAIEWLKDAQDPLAREYYEDVKRNRLRPRPAILRRANLTKSTPLTGQLSRYFETDILFGMAIGVFGTAGFFWMRRFVAKPSLAIFLEGINTFCHNLLYNGLRRNIYASRDAEPLFILRMPSLPKHTATRPK